MKREIKFRVWDIDKNRMSKPVAIYQPIIQWEDGDIEMPADFGLSKENRFIFLQYTGLKDKNKVEIYEDDIIRVIKEGVLQFRKVFWADDMAGFFTENIHFKEDTLFGFSWLNSAYSIEVIGNIYQMNAFRMC